MFKVLVVVFKTIETKYFAKSKAGALTLITDCTNQYNYISNGSNGCM